MPPNKEVTTNEIMGLLGEMKANMATKTEVGELMDFLSENMVTKEEFNRELQTEISKSEQRMTIEIRKSEQNMMNFVSDQMVNLKGDLIALTRKEDTKLLKLVEILQGKKLLDAAEAKTILSMEPFPQLFVS